MNIFDHYRQRYEAAKDEEFTLQEFLTICRQDRSAYANAAERLLMAIGEPVMVDTALEPRLSRLFSNRVIARYPAFEEFYGMEDAIEQIVSYLKHAAQGLEEKKQILYLLGPVGGGKSSLAERLKALMQRVPIYVLSANGERSPVNDHPLCLFNPQEDAQIPFDIARQAVTVGSDRNLTDRRVFTHGGNNLGEVAAQGGFPTGEANFFGAQRGESARNPAYFVYAEKAIVIDGAGFVTVRQAVGATEVAHIGNRQTQVIKLTRECIGKL